MITEEDRRIIIKHIATIRVLERNNGAMEHIPHFKIHIDENNREIRRRMRIIRETIRPRSQEVQP